MGIIKDLKTIENHISEFNEGYVLTWLYDGLYVHKIGNNKFVYKSNDIDDLLRMRIFKKDREIHIWRQGAILKMRDRSADAEDSGQTEQAQMVVVGKVTEQLAQLDSKFVLDGDDKDHYRIVINTEHYIDFNEQGLAGYVDCRFIDFEILKANKNGKSN